MKRPSGLLEPVQVVVLAGGRGTRLRPLTYDTPKPLLPVRGRPMLGHLLARLPAVCDEVILTVSHQADQLRAWGESGDDPALADRTVRVIEERDPLGTGGAVANCLEHIEGPVLVLNGDLLSDAPFEALVRHQADTGSMATIALYEVEDPSRFGVVDMDAAGRIHRFVEKPAAAEAPSQLVNAGAYVLDPDAVALIPRGRPVSIEREVFPKLAASERGMFGVPFDGLWIDCGTPASYLEVHRRLAQSAGEADGGWIAPAAHVDDAASVRESLLLDDVSVGAGAELSGCIVGPGADIGGKARLTDCVVGPGFVVAPDTHASRQRFGLRGEEGDPPAAL